MMHRGGVFPTTPRSEGGERMPESDDGQERGLRIKGWEITSRHSSIASAETIMNYEQQLQTRFLPELLFSDAGIDLKHTGSNVSSFSRKRNFKNKKKLELDSLNVSLSSSLLLFFFFFFIFFLGSLLFQCLRGSQGVEATPPSSHTGEGFEGLATE